MAHETPELVAAMRPRAGKIFAVKRVEDEVDYDTRHHPARGSAHAFEDEEDERDAERDVPVVRGRVAVPEIVAAVQDVGDHGDGRKGGDPVPPHDAVAVTLRQGKDE